MNCYVNRVPLGEPVRRLSDRVGEYQWQLAPLDEYNHVRVIAEHKEHRSDSVFSHADAQIRAPAAPRKPPRIHLVALAANRYNSEDLKLEFAVSDAESLIEKVRQSAGDYYSVGTVTLLRDQEISRRRVDEVIIATRQELQHADAQDLLVAFVAGHGIAAGGEYFFVPPDPRIKDLDLGLVQTLGIPWSDLRRLAAVPCRKVFLLDTCYAGNTALFEGNPLYHWKHEIRPIKRTESVVVCATSVGQPSFEEASLRHGLFTHGLLTGFDGLADGYSEFGFAPASQDRTVDLSELVQYVVHRVPEIAAQMGEKQQPIVSPRGVWAVPLTRAFRTGG